MSGISLWIKLRYEIMDVACEAHLDFQPLALERELDWLRNMDDWMDL